MQTPPVPPAPRPHTVPLPRELIQRRVPHIVAIYAGASWGRILEREGDYAAAAESDREAMAADPDRNLRLDAWENADGDYEPARRARAKPEEPQGLAVRLPEASRPSSVFQ